MKTLILGIGNPILTDDGIGIRVAQQINKQKKEVDVAETSEAGLSLLEFVGDYDKLIIVDSIKTGKGKPGELYKFSLEDLSPASGFSSSHGLDMATAFKLGESVGYKMPQYISIYAVEVEDNTTFGEGCTKSLEERIPELALQIVEAEKL